MKTLIPIFLFFSITGYGKRIYTISKEDFIQQFKDTASLLQVYCANHKGERVWLNTNLNTKLTIRLKDNSEKKLFLYKTTLKGSTIESEVLTTWSLFSYKKISIDINDVQTLSIVKEAYDEYERPYFSLDSVRTLVQFKNDSLSREYSTGTELVIYLKEKNNPDADTIAILINACYHLKFKDGNEAVFGVVQKITEDSIYISNSFNEAMAKANKKEYKIFAYPIQQLSELNLLKSTGRKFKKLKFQDLDITIVRINRTDHVCPCWFRFRRYDGEIYFNRDWRTEFGWAGISEQNGRPIWHE